MKVSIIVLIYNAKKFIKPLFDSIFSQTYKNLEILAIINGSTDGSKELIAQNFSQVKIIDPGENLWFCKGNNLGIRESTGDLIYLVNQDVILEPDNVEKMIMAFNNQNIGAATGKVLRYDFSAEGGSASGGILKGKTNIIDTTGILMSKSGRGRDRGQNEIDTGQYDSNFQLPNSKFQPVFGVSGAVAMYSRTALEKIKYCEIKSNCIIVHGCPSKEEDLIDITRMNAKHWIPWLAKNLRSKGLQVYTPLMPMPWAPSYEVWKKDFEKLPIDQNSILVGHSCACSFLVRWLGETNSRVKKLILVAPSKISKESSSQQIKELYTFEIDKLIKERVSQIVILLGENDSDRIKQAVEIFSKALNSSVKIIKNWGHFTFEDMGTTEFPELLDEILKTDNKQICEYFDENFVAYWEDVDLSWRLNRAGFLNVYVPQAVAYHGRTAGSSKGGYLKILNFIKHHRKLSPRLRQLNYKNHILMYIKSTSFIHPLFILREITMFVYIVLFEISTLKVLPELFRQIPKTLKKRDTYGN